ncbi:MAG: hypothetical protein KJT01_10780 [Gemmatimonadetes bacterium]|nr:hypothetical protein [Gemmatimonadota bacterium]
MPRKGSAKGTATKGTGTSARGVRLALAVVKLMALAVASAGATAWGMQRQEMVAASESMNALEVTLKAIAGLQYEFLGINQRFATWAELEAKGATLGPTQQVLRYNVASSHWYLSIIDRKTGAICDQTGELFDEAPGDRSPTCRSNPR